MNYIQSRDDLIAAIEALKVELKKTDRVQVVEYYDNIILQLTQNKNLNEVFDTLTYVMCSGKLISEAHFTDQEVTLWRTVVERSKQTRGFIDLKSNSKKN